MRVGVVIRTLDEAASIGRLLDLLRAQTLQADVVVVDSGSRDGTPAIARARGTRVLEVDHFTFGGALNSGAAACREADVLVSLSAHAFPRSADWLERMAAWFEAPEVACVFGEPRGPDGRPLAGPVRQDAAMLLAAPHWGYSNGAGAFRAALWRERGFRDDLPGAEDREWSLWALADRGCVCVLDPALEVDHDHSSDPLRVAYERWRREARGFSMFLDLPPYGVRDAVAEWWTDRGWYRSRARARLDPRRIARLAGKWAGRR